MKDNDNTSKYDITREVHGKIEQITVEGLSEDAYHVLLNHITRPFDPAYNATLKFETVRSTLAIARSENEIFYCTAMTPAEGFDS